MGKENKSLENFGVEKFMNKVIKLMVVGIILAASAAACAKAPAATETSIPTGTPLPSPTPAPTATEDPFEGLSECRTWQEAANCPITPDDFARLPDFVKTNYKFSPEAMKVSFLEIIRSERHTGFVRIHAMTYEEIVGGIGMATEASNDKEKEYIYGGSLSPVGKPYFFMLEKNPPAVNYDNVVAVFPVNNADGSMGTYTIIVPPVLFHGDNKSSEDWTKIFLARKFDGMAYLPPVCNVGLFTAQNYSPSEGGNSLFEQGTFIGQMFQDTNNLNGKRMKLFKEWEKTAIIPEELEKLPLFGSDLNLNGTFQN